MAWYNSWKIVSTQQMVATLSEALQGLGRPVGSQGNGAVIDTSLENLLGPSHNRGGKIQAFLCHRMRLKGEFLSLKPRQTHLTPSLREAQV